VGSEIERKFLCTPDAQLLTPAGTPIRQGYLTISAEAETRVRQAGERYWLTTKRGQGLVRGEFEIELTAAQFDELWPATEGLRLAKVRHEISLADAECIVDVYQGKLAGLRVAEVEFDSVESAEAFQPPAWFGREVTGIAQYANQRLATLTAADVLQLLDGRQE
jgi:CYTH domain-containing protein